MKKILGIVVMGILLSGNAIAKTTIISCISYEQINYQRSGEVIIDQKTHLEYIFELDDKNETIYQYSDLMNYFQKLSDVIWGSSIILWTGLIGDGLKSSSKLNRITGQYIIDTKMDEKFNPDTSRTINKYNCKSVDKKF